MVIRSNPFFKGAAVGEPSPLPPLSLPLSPLSLSFPLSNLVNESGPRPCSRRTKSVKFCYFGLLHYILVCNTSFISAYFTTHFLSWCVRWLKRNDVFIMLRSYVTRFLKTRFLKTRFIIGMWIRGKAPWENLQLELCEEIGKRLGSRLDILHFRSVCKNWRLSLPSPTRFPLRVPLPPNCVPNPGFHNVAFFITEVDFYYQDENCVYVAVEEVEQGRKFRPHCVIPWRGRFYCPVVSFMGDRKHPFSRFSFAGKSHVLRMALPRSNGGVEVQWDFKYQSLILKVVVISSNVDGGNNSSYARVSDLSVVGLISEGAMRGRLALLRLGRSQDRNWDWDTGFCSQLFCDIAAYKGKLCALDSLGRVFLMDYHSLRMTQIVPSWPSKINWESSKLLLFEADGGLYSVYNKTGCFLHYYKLNWQRRVWTCSDSEDLSLAVGRYLCVP